jgi:hypothetical protein
MAISLFDLTVPTYLQTLGAVAGFLDRGLAHFQENNVDPDDVVETRLFENMLPFKFQIWSVAHHSKGALDGLKAGVFGPPPPMGELTYAALQTLIADTREGVQAITADQVKSLEGGDMAFEMGGRRVPFTAENFILSFSLPNFHFHATTAYDILRTKGVPLGKRDYMGPLRIKSD